jgi:hypothetical protein
LTCRPFAVRRCWILNANKPDPVTHIVSYNPDLNNPAKAPRDFFVYMGRMTWQANPKNKFGLTYDYEGNCFCPNNVSATRTPEAATDRRFPLQRFVQVDWNSPVSGKVLVEASAIHRVERWGDMALQTGNAGNITALDPTVIGVAESPAYNNSWNDNWHSMAGFGTTVSRTASRRRTFCHRSTCRIVRSRTSLRRTTSRGTTSRPSWELRTMCSVMAKPRSRFR